MRTRSAPSSARPSTCAVYPAVLELLRSKPHAYDLIISDYAMPNVSGADVLKRAREVRPGLPGIIITGYADAQQISSRPVDVPVLNKPFTPDQLRRAIRSVHPPAQSDAAE